MDVVLLSRLQFAVATYFHFLFVPLTLGLSMILAILQTKWYRSGDEDYLRMTRFFGKLFLINFAIGVVTGITLEFQFGTNWSRYSMYVGDIFGSLLAIEATVAFFLESTFIAVWFFGWKRLSKKMHLASIWLVAVGANISAFWILVANAWMQSPVGYTIRNGRAELTDFFAVISQRFALLEIRAHGGGRLHHGRLLRPRDLRLAPAAHEPRGGIPQGRSPWRPYGRLIFSLFEVAQGHMNAEILGGKQPIKLAAMEAHWETRPRRPDAPDPLAGRGQRAERRRSTDRAEDAVVPGRLRRGRRW